jgi:hypothetical protein
MQGSPRSLTKLARTKIRTWGTLSSRPVPYGVQYMHVGLSRRLPTRHVQCPMPASPLAWQCIRSSHQIAPDVQPDMGMPAQGCWFQVAAAVAATKISTICSPGKPQEVQKGLRGLADWLEEDCCCPWRSNMQVTTRNMCRRRLIRLP